MLVMSSPTGRNQVVNVFDRLVFHVPRVLKERFHEWIDVLQLRGCDGGHARTGHEVEGNNGSVPLLGVTSRRHVKYDATDVFQRWNAFRAGRASNAFVFFGEPEIVRVTVRNPPPELRLPAKPFDEFP